MAGLPPAEVAISRRLVRGLVDDQFPWLADRALTTVGNGLDTMVFRLEEDPAADRLPGPLGVRLPRRQLAVASIEHERRWLPRLAPRLPLPVPVPVGHGAPGRGYPWSWNLVTWVDGERARPGRGQAVDAETLADFITALARPAPETAPVNPFRGVPLAARDGLVRARMVDDPRAARVWDQALQAAVWSGPPVWLHGDLHPANLIVVDWRLVGVIDFGDITAGDPATDLSVAWMVFDPARRRLFWSAIAARGGPADEDTWLRARGNALAHALALLAGDPGDPQLRAIGQHTLAQVVGG